jgi:alpha-1,2-mannosyltransferase
VSIVGPGPVPAPSERARRQLPYLPAAALVGTLAVLAVSWLLMPSWFSMIDLGVYQAGGAAALHDVPLYGHPMVKDLTFTYPPFAAVVFSPLALLGWTSARIVGVLLWLGCLYAVVSMCLDRVGPLDRLGPRGRGTGAALAVTAGLVWLEPVRGTLGLGQLNLLLLALVLADLTGRLPLLPRGVLVGIAAGIKLTPLIFVVYLLLTARRKAAGVAAATFAGTIALGWLALPGDSARFWGKLWYDPGHIGGVPFTGNQSLNGFFTRVLDGTGPARLPWLAAALVIGVGGLLVAAAHHRSGRELAGLGLCGLVGVLVSPISWSHHWVWVLPGTIAAGAAVLARPTVARVGLLVAWVTPMLVGMIYLVPHGGDREYHQNGVQVLVGNAYLIAGLAVLGLAAYRLRGPALARVKGSSGGTRPTPAGAATRTLLGHEHHGPGPVG